MPPQQPAAWQDGKGDDGDGDDGNDDIRDATVMV